MRHPSDRKSPRRSAYASGSVAFIAAFPAFGQSLGRPRILFAPEGGGDAPPPAASATPAAPAATPAAASAPPASPSAAPGGQAPGAGAPAVPPSAVPYRPEGLPDQFVGASDRETIDRLSGAYKGARETISKFGAVPEKADGYSFEASDKLKPYVAAFDKDPVYAKAREIAHAAGMPDSVFKKFVPGFLEQMIDGGLVDKPVDPKELLRTLVPASLAADASDTDKDAAASRRVRDNIAWVDGAKAGGAMPEPVAEFFAAAAADDPRAHAAIEWLRGEAVETRPAMGGGKGAGVSEADLEKRIGDPRYDPGSDKYDKSFADETDRLYRQKYGG